VQESHASASAVLTLFHIYFFLLYTALTVREHLDTPLVLWTATPPP
jgi:hypothetical protein